MVERLLTVWDKSLVSVRLSPNDAVQGVSDSDPVALFSAAAQVLRRHGIGFLEMRNPPPTGTFGKGDGPRRLDLMMGVGAGSPSLQAPSPADAMGLQMLAYQIDGRNKAAAGPQEFLARLRLHPQACDELAELTPMLQARSTLARRPVPGLEDTPLCLHAAYGIREVLTAVGWLTAQRRAPFQAGVLPLTDRKTELLFVTLDKSEGYHDSIAYHDYAISVDRFHWQTQNSAGPDTNSGRRYIESAANGWQFQLFVRPRKTDPYRACGRVTLESFEGDRPMNIVWKFTTPLPARLFREYSVLRGA